MGKVNGRRGQGNVGGSHNSYAVKGVSTVPNPNPRHARPGYVDRLEERKRQGGPAKRSTATIKGPSHPGHGSDTRAPKAPKQNK